MIAAVDTSVVVTAVLTTILGGGLIAAIAAFIKARPEAEGFTVVASERVVVLQQGYIDKQEKRLADLEAAQARIVRDYEERLAGLLEERRLLENDRGQLRIDLAHTSSDRDKALAQVKTLTTRVSELEGRVAELENGHQS